MQKRIDDLIKIAYERGTTSKINQLYASLAAICDAEDLQNLHRRWNEMVEFKQIERWDLEFNDELINPTVYKTQREETGFGQAQAKSEHSILDYAYTANSTSAIRPHPMMGTTGAGK